MPLGNIVSIKGIQDAYQSLLVVAITFQDSVTSPTTLLLSTHGLKSAEAGFAPSGISSFPYNGQEFEPRILNQDIAATQALSDNGIDITPTVTIELADPDKAMWAFEKTIGFKGAKLVMYEIFWDVGTSNFSSDFQTIFVGTCGPGKVSETKLTIQSVSRMNMNQSYLPQTRIQKRCPWVFPDTTGLTTPEATEIHQQAADDPSAPTYRCGYSKLATGGNAAGNNDSAGAYFKSCTYTFDACIDRLGDRTPTGNHKPIEYDQAGHLTGRFGGVRWDSPLQFKSRGFGEKKDITAFNANNESKYNDYIPMGWGTYWIEPPILSIVGDANFTAMEVVLGMGYFQNVRKVIVNDIDVDELSSEPSTQKAQIGLQLFWVSVTEGVRNGRTNKDAIYDGQGDPYGSQKVIEIKVPRQLTPSSSIPRIRCLVDGPQVRVYSDVNNYTDSFTANPSWILLNILALSSWRYEDIDIQTFIDFAEVCDESINYNGHSGFVNVAVDGVTVTHVAGNEFDEVSVGQTIFINGISKIIATITSYTQLTITISMGGALSNVTFISNGSNSHARFRIGFGLSQRTSVSDLIRQIRTAARCILIPSSSTGKLQIFGELTLADQQGSVISGSNFDTPIRSFSGNGTGAGGYVAWKFDYSSIIPNSNGESSLTIDQLSIKDTPNKVSFPFLDEDNQFQSDSLTLIDAEDQIRVDQPVDGSIPVIGILNFDQAKRIAAVWMAKNFRGNVKNDTSGTYILSFTTSFKCLHLRMGHIVLVDYPQLGLNPGLLDLDSNEIAGFLARVIAIKPSTNFQTVQITLQFHNDDWYSDVFEQNGFQKSKPQFRNALTRAAFPWAPYYSAPKSTDKLYSPTDFQFGVFQQYELSESNQPIARISSTGKLPINTFSELSPPKIGIQGSTAPTGGTVKAGKRYYIQICVRDAAGLSTAPSDPSAPCIIDVPAGADTATLTVNILNWPKNAVTADIFAATIRNRMTWQKTITVTPPSNPATATLTSFNDRAWGIPDVEFNAIGIRGKQCLHAGIIGAEILSVTSTTITLSLSADNQFTTNQFAPASGNPYYVMLVAIKGNGIPFDQIKRTINYDTGTVSITNNWDGVSANPPEESTIIGAGTSWTSALVGKDIYIAGLVSGVPTGLTTKVKSVTDSTHIVIAGPVKQTTGSGISYEIFSEIFSANQFVPIANWSISSNTGNTLTISGPDPTLLDRGDGSVGLQPGDVIVVSMRPTVDVDSIGNYIEDKNWDNALGPLGEEHSILIATNTTPIQITSADNHGLLSRQKIYSRGAIGNTAVNGPLFVDVISDDEFNLYQNRDLTIPVAGVGTYTGGGIFNLQFDGMTPHSEIGHELFCAFGAGSGGFYKIKDNTRDRIYIEGEWGVVPDATSVFFILGPNWDSLAETENINNSVESTDITFDLGVPNYAGKVVFVQSFTKDGSKNEAFRSLAPWRLIFIYGSQAEIQLGDLNSIIAFTND